MKFLVPNEKREPLVELTLERHPGEPANVWLVVATAGRHVPILQLSDTGQITAKEISPAEAKVLQEAGFKIQMFQTPIRLIHSVQISQNGETDTQS